MKAPDFDGRVYVPGLGRVQFAYDDQGQEWNYELEVSGGNSSSLAITLEAIPSERAPFWTCDAALEVFFDDGSSEHSASAGAPTPAIAAARAMIGIAQALPVELTQAAKEAS